MPFQHLLDEYNKHLINTYGTSLKYKNYYSLVHGRLFNRYNNDFDMYFIEIQLHHREFYIHHNKLYQMNIIPSDTINIKLLLDSTGFVEGLDYIMVANNLQLYTKYSNIVYYNRLEQEEKLALSDIVNVKNWRIFDPSHVGQLLKIKNAFQLPNSFKMTENFILTPRTFIIMAMKTNINYAYSDYFVNNDIIHYGYIKYLKLSGYLKYKNKLKKEKSKQLQIQQDSAYILSQQPPVQSQFLANEISATTSEHSESDNINNENTIQTILSAVNTLQEDKCVNIHDKLDRILISMEEIFKYIKQVNNSPSNLANEYSKKNLQYSHVDDSSGDEEFNINKILSQKSPIYLNDDNNDNSGNSGNSGNNSDEEISIKTIKNMNIFK